jgi:glycerophosphoryl diester phosphodiesterase
MTDMIFIAHRGASGHEPENTLRSIGKALEMGARWIEIDVYAVEGKLVVIHDEQLERTTSGHGLVTDRSLEYLRTLDAGKGERIPLLREVLDLIGPRAALNVELKGPGAAGPLATVLAGYIQGRGWSRDRLLVSSFQVDELVRFKQDELSIPLGLLVSGFPVRAVRKAVQLGASSIHVGLRYVSAGFVDRAHRQGLKVLVFTVNKASDVRRMQDMGVDGLFTDYPELNAD